MSTSPLNMNKNKAARVIRVLIVDDHRILREGLRSLLEKTDGIKLAGESSDGLDALMQVKKLKPDVVIMDITMPRMNGIEASRRIKAMLPDVKILALSMHSDKALIKRMFAAGATGYLLKDCVAGELLDAIAAVSKDEYYVTTKISQDIISEFIQNSGQARMDEKDNISPREHEVLKLLAEGFPVSQISDMLSISIKTVETHRRNIMEKLNLKSIVELTKYAIREGITSVDE